MPHKTPKRTVWTLYESQKHGMTPELMTAFRKRAEADGVESITALVRLMREYIASQKRNPDEPGEISTGRSQDDRDGM